LDGQLFENGLLDQFQAEGVEVQIRSVFLQGVLIGKPRKGTSIPRLVLDEAALFRAKCKKQGLDPLGAAMAQILRASPDPKIVIGVTGVDELDAILCSLADAQAPANYDPPPWRREFDPRTWCH
jgi:aryl-alcohol dehydrogenase-like predicted oxidoreductase